MEYHNLLKEIIEFWRPAYHIDIHTYQVLKDFKPDEKLMSYDDIGIQIYTNANRSSLRAPKIDSNNVQNESNTSITEGSEPGMPEDLFLQLKNAFQGDVSL